MNTAENVTKRLIEKNLTITFMESCTGGLLASMFTDTSGASAVFKGSLVTYSNEMKISAGVPAKVIEEHGVYSIECARAMASAARKSYGSDIAVGITGTTGNVDPANADSVEGVAYFCICIGDAFHNQTIRENVAGMSRKEIKQFYAAKVYDKLNELMEVDGL